MILHISIFSDFSEVSSDTVGRNVKQPTWTTVYFPASDLFVVCFRSFTPMTVSQSPPVVFSQVQTSNDAHWVSTRQKFTTISNFLVALEEEERNEQTHGGEIIGWLAMEEGAGIWSDDTKYEVGLQPSVNHQWFVFPFEANFFFLVQIVNIRSGLPSTSRTPTKNHSTLQQACNHIMSWILPTCVTISSNPTLYRWDLFFVHSKEGPQFTFFAWPYDCYLPSCSTFRLIYF